MRAVGYCTGYIRLTRVGVLNEACAPHLCSSGVQGQGGEGVPQVPTQNCALQGEPGAGGGSGGRRWHAAHGEARRHSACFHASIGPCVLIETGVGHKLNVSVCGVHTSEYRFGVTYSCEATGIYVVQNQEVTWIQWISDTQG